MEKPQVVILMGVSGSGKTTIGELLAQRLGWPFFDGDDFHPPANIEKMRNNIPLSEADRMPWLATLRTKMESLLAASQSAVLACSALTAFDREKLVDADPRMELVYLKGDYDLIRRRLAARQEHFFKVDLLPTQFQTLQEPEGAFVVDISPEPEAIVDTIVRHLQAK